MRKYQYEVEFKERGSDRANELTRRMTSLDKSASGVDRSFVGASKKSNHFSKGLNSTNKTVVSSTSRLDKLSGELNSVKSSTDQASNSNRRFKKELREMEAPAKSGSNALGGLKRAAFGLITVTALFGAASGMSRMGSEIESARVSFETMLGSAEAGVETLNKLNDFSNVTPFTNDEVIASGRNLIAFGIENEKLITTLKNVGDVSAGLKIPFNELSELYGKIKVQNTVYSEDLNQLAGRGVPIFTELAKVMGVQQDQVKKLASQGKIHFKEIEKSFENMTSKGGMFFNMMEKQSKTFDGRTSTLQGKLGLVAAGMGEGLNKKLTPAMDGAIAVTDSLLEAMKPVSKQYEEQKDKVRRLSDETRPLINRYDELAGKTKLNKDEQAELKTITEKLGDALPSIVTKWSRFGEALSISTDKFKEFKGLQEDYLKNLNKEALLDAKMRFQSTRIRGEDLFNKINTDPTFDKNVFGLVAKSFHERHGDKKRAEQLSDFRSIMGSGEGHGELGVAINEIRRLSGLGELTPSQIKGFNPGKNFIGYRELLTKKIGEGEGFEGSEGSSAGDFSGAEDGELTAGLQSITAGGSKNVTINMPGIKFAENFELKTETIEEGVDDIEQKFREMFVRVLNSGLATTTQF